MHTQYRIIFIISSLLFTLSLSISLINYFLSLESTHQQLKERSLPLTIDNIYTEIQKHIIEPNLVSSMMAHDTFMKDWLVNDENNVQQITRYLETIKNKYGMFATFLVSDKTKHYYSSKGFIETVQEDRLQNLWYFAFKNSHKSHEINLDFNAHMDNSLIMFINHKILDDNYHMLGATGIAMRVSYIDDMLKKFRQRYYFDVYFANKDGEIILSQQDKHSFTHLKERPDLYAMKDVLLNKEATLLEHEKDNEKFLIMTKYIPELDLYLLVEAKVSRFTTKVTKTFYFNLIASLLITIFITLIILFTVMNYHKKLNYLADHDTLTDLPNRRAFDKDFQHFFMLHKRNASPISMLFLDIDDFKNINDTLGHKTGDEVLQRIADILKQHVRKTDLIARWGGEEFTIALIDSDVDEALKIAEKLQEQIETDILLRNYANRVVTSSFGLTGIHKEDTTDTFLRRADEALYKAKANGKNQVVVL